MGELSIFLVTAVVFTVEDLPLVSGALLLPHRGVGVCEVRGGAHLGLLLAPSLCPSLLDVDRMLPGDHTPGSRQAPVVSVLDYD